LETPRRPDLLIPRPPPEPPLEAFAHQLSGSDFERSVRAAGIEGASTHSFRRTALTQMSNAGIPLRIIQEISGHSNLEQLQRYLEVKPDQVKGAIAQSAPSPTVTRPIRRDRRNSRLVMMLSPPSQKPSAPYICESP
jgi:hypothetical protein